MLLSDLHFNLWLLDQLYLWPSHMHHFISYLLLDTPHTYLELATLFKCSFYTSNHKLDPDIYLSDQIG